MSRKASKPTAPPRQKPAAVRRELERQAAARAAADAARRRIMIAAAGGVLAVAVIVVGLVFFRGGGHGSVKAGAAIDSSIPVSGLTIGNPDAPVTLVEYADFQCASCAAMYRDGLPQLLQEYIATGKVALTFMPNAILGDESIAATEAALCAADQGQFWPMHNTLFANQDGENDGAFSTGRLEAMAKKIGLDTGTFNACLENHAHAGDEQNYHATAQQDGISSAPTFVINNGEPFGWDSWDALKAEIDSALGL